MITVECNDGVCIDVDKEMAMSMSGTIRSHLENRVDSGTNKVPLENINSSTLLKVLEFCSVHSKICAIPTSILQWDEKFIRLEPSELCELASAAYYLEIRPLVDLTCRAIAKLLKGKSPAEIRRTFNILYDFSPGDDVPPPTIRDKLRTKLHYKDKQKSKNKDSLPSSQDNRSLDELVSFINQENNSLPKHLVSSKKTKSKKKSKLKKGNDLSLSQENSTNLSDEERNQLTNDNKQSISTDSSGSPPTTTLSTNNSNTLLGNSASILIAPLSSLTSALETSQTVPTSFGLLEKDQANNRTLAKSLSDIPDDIVWESEDDSLDPVLKAEQDKEVEEFRARLESMQRAVIRPKIVLPSLDLFSLNVK